MAWINDGIDGTRLRLQEVVTARPFSILTWVKLITRTNRGTIVCANPDVGGAGLLIYNRIGNTSSNTRGRWGATQIENSRGLPVGSWFAFGLVAPETGPMLCYLDNGTSFAVAADDAYIPGPGQILTFGSEPAGARTCEMKHDEIAVWDVELSPAQVAAFYAGRSPQNSEIGVTPWAHWRQNVLDSETSARTLIIDGGLTTDDDFAPVDPPDVGPTPDPVVTSVNGGAPVFPGQTDVPFVGSDIDQGANPTFNGRAVSVSNVTAGGGTIDVIPSADPYTTGGDGINRTAYVFEFDSGTGAPVHLVPAAAVVAAEYRGAGTLAGGAWLPPIGPQTPPIVGDQIELTDPAGGLVDVLEERGRAVWSGVTAGERLAGSYRIYSGGAWSAAAPYIADAT